MSKKRTMQFIQKDNWDRPIYKCKETGNLWKDINLGRNAPILYSCGNNIDGEPDMPIKSTLEITFIDQYKENAFRHQYMMLSRLKSDCEYYLNYGNRTKKHLYYLDEKEHIKQMKQLYNLLPEKPQWLTYEQILEYEKLMLKEG